MSSSAVPPRKTAVQYALDWAQSPLPPTLLATLTTALHARPLQPLPLLFTPALLLSTYMNLSGAVVDAAGLSAAWSGLYLVLANRRRQARFVSRFGARGLTRGVAMGVAGVNLVSGGLAYGLGRREGVDS